MVKVRTVFTKLDRAKYISHLDLMRCMTRALKRSGLKIWYTEGFNPHAYIMFPLALSLGTESRVEVMDFNLTEDIPFDEVKSRLNAVLPRDIRIVSVSEQVMKHTEIGFSSYHAEFRIEDMTAEDCKAAFGRLLAQETIDIEKRSKKKGMVAVDIKPHVEMREVVIRDGLVCADFTLPAGIPLNLNAGALLDAFSAPYGERFIVKKLERTAILDSSHNEFV